MMGTATHRFGLEGRLDLADLQAVPVDAAEEGVLSDITLALCPAAQTLGWVFGHQLQGGEQGHTILQLRGENRGIPFFSYEGRTRTYHARMI